MAGGLAETFFEQTSQSEDPVIFLARKIGVGRVSQTARMRLAEVLERVRALQDRA